MRTPAAPPYLLPPDEAVSLEPWLTSDGTELAERLDHWDPFTDIDLVCAVTVDLDATRFACRLDPDSALALTGSWRSDLTRLAGEGEPVELGTLDGTIRAPVGVLIPGSAAGGHVDLSLRLVLRSAGSAPSPISPVRPGAILWTDVARVTLEGAAARFPVTAIDFAETRQLPQAGSWALEWDADDLDTPVLGGLRLLVNASDEQLLQALRSGSTDGRSAVVRSFVTFDVARSLVHGALRNERFVDDPEAYEDGTLGRMLYELLAACWPGMPVRAVRARSIDDPSRLDADIQAHVGLLA